ncbi:phasin family protein [Pelagibius sp.]|uniref:phasin family protein n=1 Tax=Pelagibius sp. TaxID=1931238 RepID=UPI002637C081|nr:phasin family protein [Pelagibius sp.]
MATTKSPGKPAAAKRGTAKSTAAKRAPTKAASTKAAAPKRAVPKPAASKPAAPKAPPAAAETVAPLLPLEPAVEALDSIQPMAEEAFKPVEAVVAAGQETLETVVKAGTQAAVRSYEQAFALTQEQVEKASSTVFQRYDDVSRLSKDNLEACVRSSEVVAKGVEAFGEEVASFSRDALETGMQTAQSMATAKSLREVIDLQSEYSRKSLESFMAETAKLAGLSIAMTSDAFAPLQSRVAVTVEKMMKPVAA